MMSKNLANDIDSLLLAINTSNPDYNYAERIRCFVEDNREELDDSSIWDFLAEAIKVYYRAYEIQSKAFPTADELIEYIRLTHSIRIMK